MKMGDLSPADRISKQQKGFSPECAPLAALDNISIRNEGGFLNNFAKLEKVVKALPLGLPKRGRYVLELQNDVLRICGDKVFLQQFEIIGPKVTLQSLRPYLEGIKIELALGKSTFCVQLLYQNFSQDSELVERRTSPWRASQLESTPESSGSESRTFLGSGER